MPQKKKDGMGLEKPVSEVHADHELFLQAFEKPTQIYRFLRSRNVLCPIFLQRTLYYMRGRMSRSHKNRMSFKLDYLLDKVTQKIEKQTERPASYLNIAFTGFHDEKLEGVSGDVARVETFIVKMCHKKRKESSAPMMQVVLSKMRQSHNPRHLSGLVSVGTQDVNINPPEGEGGGGGGGVGRNATLSIPTHNFTASNGHQVKSYVLVFRVSLVHDQENAGEPVAKRRRISRSSSQDSQDSNISTGGTNSVNGDAHNGVGTTYCGELVMFDRHGRCLLTPGHYELMLEQQVGDNLQLCKSSPKKNASWESIDTLKFDNVFKCIPVLKFSLNWNSENSNSCIERPRLRPLKPLDVVLANSASTKPKPQGVASPEAPQLVLYQFVYNNNSRQQTEARRDFHCPWCSLNCMALYSLLKHLKLCHARFTFTYVPHPKGARIDVALNECYDGSYAGNPQDLVTMPAGFAFSRSGPTRRTPNTTVLVCRPKRPKPSLSEFLEQDDNDFDLPRSYILGHNRLYHHTMTCLPIQPHELDEDSEGEHDSEWVRQKTQMMIDEFSDVNEGEKELMKMWNLHVMKYNFVGDSQIPLACSMFLESHGTELLRKSLYRNFVLHMISLHDFGLIGTGVVYKSILQLQSKMQDIGVQKQLAASWEDQRKTAKKLFPSLGSSVDVKQEPSSSGTLMEHLEGSKGSPTKSEVGDKKCSVQ
ncbi:polycomb protein suz12-A-like isoform X2 [Penaeus chinensis]|uniref:polycomb protein suz12-A-like isoform X2 n=1 Tax=Penaeus chinensis TaxID=139456 RepID=UPI001FB5AE70|nr:polycomb protein suz12-A-like isoform X2 [Penaeus chinensis]